MNLRQSISAKPKPSMTYEDTNDDQFQIRSSGLSINTGE